MIPFPKQSWLRSPELSLETLQFYWKGLQVRHNGKQHHPVPKAGTSSGPCLSSLHDRNCWDTSYSLELFHKGTMVSYILPEAFENGADVVADCKLVIELASGSGMFYIWKKEEISKPSHQDSLATPCCLQCDELQAPRETSRDEIQFPFRSRHLTSHYKKQHYTFFNLDPASLQKKNPQKPKHSALFNSVHLVSYKQSTYLCKTSSRRGPAISWREGDSQSFQRTSVSGAEQLGLSWTSLPPAWLLNKDFGCSSGCTASQRGTSRCPGYRAHTAPEEHICKQENWIKNPTLMFYS